MDKSEIIELIEDGKARCALLKTPGSFSDSGIATTIGEINGIFDQSVGADTGIK